jgi:hypothetical protein
MKTTVKQEGPKKPQVSAVKSAFKIISGLFEPISTPIENPMSLENYTQRAPGIWIRKAGK